MFTTFSRNKILAKRAARHHRLAGPGASRARAFHLHRPAAAEPVTRLLQHAQQLRLEPHRHVADLVEQQRAAVRRLEQSRCGAVRAGERALLVSEQLGFEQVLGHRGAIDRDERPGGAAASGGGCERANTSLPVPEFPRDQHARPRSSRDLFCTPDGGLHHRVAHDHRVAFRLTRPPGSRRSVRGRGAVAGTRGRRRGSRVPPPRDCRRYRRRPRVRRSAPPPSRAPARRRRARGRTTRGRPVHRPAAARGPPRRPSACSSLAPRAIAIRAAWPNSAASEPMISTRMAELPANSDRPILRIVQFSDRAGSQIARSALTISVIVTPSRLSSTITTSPRATRRLLT